MEEDILAENVSKEEKLQWYFRPWVIVFAILFFGPLGLLLVWFRPRTAMWIKATVSAVVLIFTFWIMHGTVTVYRKMLDYYRELGALVQDV